jgi:hypothetical protein
VYAAVARRKLTVSDECAQQRDVVDWRRTQFYISQRRALSLDLTV